MGRVVTPSEPEIDWLYGLQHFGIKLGLQNISALLDVLGHPERAYPSVLIAGTNGKGSVAAMMHAVLQAAGLRAGMFTSPHLVHPRERIRIGERDIEVGDLCRRLAGMRERIEAGVGRGAIEAHPSFFEVIAATALQSFHDEGVQAALLEVGLGGRLDATNAVDACLSVIVSIDLDHTKSLGATTELIAAEKAGIVKPGRPVISGVVRQQAVSVLQRTCRERGSPLIEAGVAVQLVEESDGAFTLESSRARYERLRLSLGGRHQIHNARVAVAACEQLAEHAGFEIEPRAVRRGLAATRWPGRLQWVRSAGDQPDLLFDGAHNPAGAASLARYLDTLEIAHPVILFGAMQGKLLPQILDALAPFAHRLVLTRPAVRRAAEPEEIAALARERIERVDVVADPAEAFERARDLAGNGRFVLVTGSLYLVGEILGLLEHRDAPGPVSM